MACGIPRGPPSPCAFLALQAELQSEMQSASAAAVAGMAEDATAYADAADARLSHLEHQLEDVVAAQVCSWEELLPVY